MFPILPTLIGRVTQMTVNSRLDKYSVRMVFLYDETLHGGERELDLHPTSVMTVSERSLWFHLYEVQNQATLIYGAGVQKGPSPRRELSTGFLPSLDLDESFLSCPFKICVLCYVSVMIQWKIKMIQSVFLTGPQLVQRDTNCQTRRAQQVEPNIGRRETCEYTTQQRRDLGHLGRYREWFWFKGLRRPILCTSLRQPKNVRTTD